MQTHRLDTRATVGQLMDATDELLESFLPTQLLGRLYGTRGQLPAESEFWAGVLFIDVSRFTALVEQLGRRGNPGLEQLSRVLSQSYARCAEQVVRRGGEIVYFAGDSLLAYWDADRHGLAGAVRNAVDCADAICREHRQRSDPASMREGDPALHFGVGAGKLWVAAIGGEPIWNLVVGGEAVVEAAKCLGRARSWQYVLSEAATKLFEQRSPDKGRVIDEHCSHNLPRRWFAGFLAPPIQHVLAKATVEPESTEIRLALDQEDRTLETRLRALAEIRPISALFARISGIQTGASDVLARHQELCIALQRIVREGDGPAGQLQFEDKGLIFTAAFGVRGAFHRDDAPRAVDSALAIREAVHRFNLSASIGVATGEAFFGVVGSARRQQLMVQGPAVNRAARLMTATVDDILCDSPTERAARTLFSFERRGAVQLEGLGDMAPVFRPMGATPLKLTSTSLIGRHNELNFLRQSLEDTSADTNRLVIVLGEPGIGKTALVNAFMEELRANGKTVCLSRAERDDRRTSLLAWRRILEALVGLPTDTGGAELFRCISLGVGDRIGVSERLPLLGDMLGIEVPQNESTRHLEGAHRADATMRLIGEIVGCLAPRPLTIVLEDSQWLDSASWRLVEWVLGSLSSLMLILCVRAEEVPDELRNLQQRAKVVETEADADAAARYLRILELSELSDTSIHSLVAWTLGGAPPQDEIMRRVAALAGGNPFFAEEISLTLKSEGLIAERDGLWRSIRPLDGLQYFVGVERTIRERVDRLDGEAQDVLKAAAVIGRSFTRTELAALKGDSIDRPLEILKSAHLVRGPLESGLFEFRHDQIRDVVYSSIPSDVRMRLHGALASWMEKSRRDPLGGDTAVLVQHFEAAGNDEKAVEYADVAATDALEIGAFREVESFLDICMKHEPKRELWSNEQLLQSVRWRRQLAEAHYSRGDIHAQGVAVRYALSVAGRSVPRTSLTTYAALAARGVTLAIRQAFPLKSETNDADTNLRWQAELARCLNQAAMVDYFELRFSRGMCNLVGALIHAEKTGFSADTAVASAQLACGFGMLGWMRVGGHFMDRAERVAIALADPAIHTHVCNLDALWRLGRCDWSMVDQRLDQAQALSLKAGDQLRWCNAQGMRFWSQYYRGDQSAWEPTSLMLLARAQNAGNIQQEIWALRCKALCLLHTDRPREAADILGLITTGVPGSVDLAAQVSAMGALALALSRVGQAGKAVEAAVETLRLLGVMGRPSSHSIIVGISGALEVLLRGREAGLAQRYDRWGEWERQGLKELKRYSRVFPVGLAQRGLWLGVSNWLDGDKDRALSVWKQALSNARRLSLRKDESMIAAEIRRRQH
jgi:class 3 adenylate cyclase